MKKKTEHFKQYSVTDNTVYMLKTARSVNKHAYLYIILWSALSVITPLVPSVILKLMIDVIDGEKGGSAVIYIIAAYIIISIVTECAKNRIGYHTDKINVNIRYSCMSLITGKSMRIPYADIESRKMRNILDKAENFVSMDYLGAGKIADDYKNILCDIFGITVAISLIASLNPIMSLVLIVTGILVFTIQYKLSIQDKETVTKLLPYAKKLKYLAIGKPTEIKAAKDIRIYNISSWFSALSNIIIGDRKKIMDDFIKHLSLVSAAEALICIIRDTAVMYFLITAVLQGKTDASGFVFYFGIINAFNLWVVQISSHFGFHVKQCMQCADFRMFVEAEDECGDENADINADIPDGCEIEFDNISFSYDNCNKALDGVSLKVGKKEKIAIVGENGAGKTTCMKLLCGLYAPSSGTVKINGTDISQLSVRQRYSLFSAVFQDAFCLAGSIRDNIVLSDICDNEKLNDAIAKAGLSEKTDSLKNGVDTPIDRELYKDAVSFSGGEMQKLFLARALYKDAPVIILDEPTAALDPIAENELYMRFNELSKNKTAFYISHRLSSTRFCDRIIFLENGKITEIGTHEQLMQLKGSYCKMYKMQSYYYNIDRGGAYEV